MIHLIAATRITPVPGWWISFGTWSSHLGVGGLLAFAGVYILATLCLVPGWLLRYGAGFAFGLVRGTCIALTGGIVGAVIAFWLARRWGREAVRRRFAGTEVFQRVERALSRKGTRIVFLSRLCPILPVGAINYLFGLTAVRFRSYLHASVLAMVPGVLLYVYLGAVSRTELAIVIHHGWGMARLGLWGVGLVAAALVAAEFLRPRRRDRERDSLALARMSAPDHQD